MNRSHRILIVDDEESIRYSLTRYLGEAGYAPCAVSNPVEARREIESGIFEVAIVDRMLANGNNGLELMAYLRRKQPFCQAILISGYPSFESAAEAISLKVFAYLAKPVRKHQILPVVEQALDRYRALQADQGRDRMFTLLLETNPDAVAVHDPAGSAVFVNPAFTRLFGFTREDVAEGRLPALPEPERFAGSGRAEAYPAFRVTKDGRRLPVRVTQLAVAGAGGEPAYRMAVYHEADTASRPGDREERDAFLGGIAHDFNSLITTILGNSELCEMYLEDRAPENIGACLKAIVTAGERARQLAGKIAPVNRRTEFQPVRLDLLVDETLLILGPTLPGTITVHRFSNVENPVVAGDTGQLQRVLVNLCNNAIQAMEPGGGVLTIGIDPETTPPGFRLTVRDTGCGIDPEIRNRIFQPFFTTRSAGKGTGLGLHLARTIINESGGTIAVESEPGNGATFSVFLPEWNGTTGVIENPEATVV